MLLTLPVRMRSLLVSRMFLVYGYMLPLHVGITLPALIMYSLDFGMTFWFVIFSLLMLLIGQLVPLILSALSVSLLVRTTGTFRYKTIYEVVIMTAALGLMIFVQSVPLRIGVDPSASIDVMYTYLEQKISYWYQWNLVIALIAGGVRSSFWYQAVLGYLITFFVSVGAAVLTRKKVRSCSLHEFFDSCL